jgi:uncharacterized protein
MIGELWMNKTTLGMASAAGVLAIVAFFKGGWSLVGKGLVVAGQTFVGVFPLLVVAFIVAGLVTILMPKTLVAKWLGKESGWKGPVLGSVMGALVPGGPFFFYPLMSSLIVSGANVGTMISFVAAKTLWNLARLPVEVVFVGWKVTIIRFLITFPVPILAGLAVDKFFPVYAEKIRLEVMQLQLKKTAQKSGAHID